MQRIQLQQRPGNPLPVFKVLEVVEWSRIAIRYFKRHRTIVVAFALEKLIQTAHRPLAALIDKEVAGDGEKPCLKPRLAVILPTTHQNTHPDLLEEVLSLFAIAGQIEQIAEQTVLVTNDQLVQKPGILTLEPCGDCQAFLAHLFIYDACLAR